MECKHTLAAIFFSIAFMLILSVLTACENSTSVKATTNDLILNNNSSRNDSLNTQETKYPSIQDSLFNNTLSSSSQIGHQEYSSFNISSFSENNTPSSSSCITSSFVKNIDLTEALTYLSSSTNEQTPHQIFLDKDGFAKISDVYKSITTNEKVVFVIRHSERENSVTIETELTENGILIAESLGATLKSDEEFSYITSGFVRTNETANHIAIGRETPNPIIITNYDITGNWFLKISADELATYANELKIQGSSIELMSLWAYGKKYPDVFYELENRAKEFIEKVIFKNLNKWNRVSIMVSHDIFVMPLTVYGSNKNVALKYFEDYHWINYMAGIAIIINENNEIKFIPIKGSDSGIIDYLEIYKNEHHLNF